LSERRQDAIRELVRSTYEDPRVVARYVDIGLWPAEEVLVLEYFPDGSRVLDVGCGAGRTSIPLAEQGFKVVGIDLSQTMVTVARQQAELANVEIDFQVMDATNLQFPPDSFDVVLFSYNGLELLPGRTGKIKALEEVWRVLKKDGLFVFTSHSPFALNQYAPYRLANFLKFLAGRLLRLPIKEREFGERFIDDEGEEVKYLQILPPLVLMGMLGDCGFEIALYNTRKRIEKGKKFGWRGIFEDGERFYVARKK
jgi:ubiquinone/menaquinone biosynthesis C-methylase UbiE